LGIPHLPIWQLPSNREQRAANDGGYWQLVSLHLNATQLHGLDKIPGIIDQTLEVNLLLQKCVSCHQRLGDGRGIELIE
jgi:hypothetical protein